MRILNFRESKDLVVLVDPNGKFASNSSYMDWVLTPRNVATKDITDKGWEVISERLEIDTNTYEFIWTWDTELEDLELDDPS